MPKKLIMLQGLPASGKSTIAREFVKQGYKRVNKDDLRAMIDSSVHSKQNEKLILSNEIKLAKAYLEEGYSVVIDDTNFTHENTWREVAKECGAEFEVKFVDTPFMECIERDAMRGDKKVGAKVIQGMYDRYIKHKDKLDWTLPSAYIFDIDGTLAHMNGRSPYDYSKVHTDTLDESVGQLLEDLRHHANIIVVSGRDGGCKEETIKWLHDKGVRFDLIYMRAEGDNRCDSVVKREIYEKNIKGKYNVVAVFDDRNRVVEMWRSLGLTCCQVGYGYF